MRVDLTSEVAVEAPNERDGHQTVALVIEAPPAVRIVSASAPDGWTVARSDQRVTWSGGTISGSDAASFPIELRGVGPAGAVSVRAWQRYDDGAVVRWRAELTVLPAAAAPPSHLSRALVAGAMGLGVVAISLLVLHRMRRRPLQDG